MLEIPHFEHHGISGLQESEAGIGMFFPDTSWAHGCAFQGFHAAFFMLGLVARSDL